MKTIETIKKGRAITIQTRWLRIEEAAEYLGVVRSTFDELRKKIPFGQFGGVVLYDCHVLDRYANHEFPDEYYEPEKPPEKHKCPRRGDCWPSIGGLQDPVTGKVFNSHRKTNVLI
jgi:excisionase family DNA binding protein